MPPDTNDIARNSIFRNAPDEPSSDIVERASVFRAQTVDEKARTVEVVLATETAIQCLDRASWSPC